MLSLGNKVMTTTNTALVVNIHKMKEKLLRLEKIKIFSIQV